MEGRKAIRRKKYEADQDFFDNEEYDNSQSKMTLRKREGGRKLSSILIEK